MNNLRAVFEKTSISMLIILFCSIFSLFISAQTTEFVDVDKSDWYFESVQVVSKHGLMTGVLDSNFAPDGELTYAQALTISARLNSLYTSGKDDFTLSSPWYKVYFDYALDANITDIIPKEPDKSITRKEFAYYLANAMPKWALFEINNIEIANIPDITKDEYSDNICLLYKSGIVLGVDESLSFNPDKLIKRSEVAAILARAIYPTERLRSQMYPIERENAALSVKILNNLPEEKVTIKQADEKIIKKYTDKASELTNIILSNTDTLIGELPIYFVSENGNDSNDGKSPLSPWKSLEKVNSTVQSGTVLFERGSMFRGQLLLTNGVTFSAYGVGEKPEIRVSTDASSPDLWKSTTTPNVYECTLKLGESVGNIVFDSGKAWGILKQSGYKNVGIDGFVSNGIEKYSGISIANSYKDLKNNLEFFYDTSIQKLYLCSKAGNPAEVFESIEICTKKSGAVKSPQNGLITRDVTVNNIHFSNAGVHGIALNGLENVTVEYCKFSFIGGCVQKGTLRYGNAVENFGECDGFIVRNCYTYQAYDCAYTAQWQGNAGHVEGEEFFIKNVSFYNNVSDFANNCLEFWIKENDGVSGKRFAFDNCNAWGNFSLNNGYGFGQQRDLLSSSMFYGNLCGESTEFINFNVFDNVMINSTAYAVFAYKLDLSDGFKLRNNVYIHEYGKTFANIYYSLYPFNEKTLNNMAKKNMEAGGVYYYTLPENKSKKEIDESGLDLTLYALDFGKGSDDRQFCDYSEKDGIMCARLTPNYDSKNASNEAYKIHFSVAQAIKLENLNQSKYRYATVKYYYEVPKGRAPSSDKIILRPYSSELSWLGYIDSKKITANKWDSVTIDIGAGELLSRDAVWSQFQLQVFGGLNASAIPNGESFYINEMIFHN